MRTRIVELKHPKKEVAELLGQTVNVKGWVRTVRKQKNFSFVEVNDGSCLTNLQVVVDSSLKDYEKVIERLTTGVSVSFEGEIAESPATGQKLELKAVKVEILGSCDQQTYPLQKKRHTFEFLRTIAHLRPRTNTIGAVTRVRNALSFATHCFFQERGFLYIHSPIITASDCEGAGQMFRVSTIDPAAPPKTQEGKVDYKQDFFGKPAYLTVSGQLNAEIYACALSDVYTFGPTFRAENSNTSRHLAEFWMVEPEMAFADLKDDQDLAEAYIKYMVRYLFNHCNEDLHFFDKYISTGLLDRLKTVLDKNFERVTYSFCIRILEKSGKQFNYPVAWGNDLQTEHERYLCEEYFNGPVIISDYPKEIKAFYMRGNEDGKTVAAMDVLLPRVGEIIGGSQREERLSVLEERMRQMSLSEQDYWWYLELRKYGSVPHSGFGLGLERMVQFATGMENIRDVIPFPRAPDNAEF